MEAKCLYDFNKTADDELSFKKGDIIKILKEDETDEKGNWWHAELNGVEGVIPKTYVEKKVKSNSWFKGKITRSYAEQFLLDPVNNFPNGAFVVRESESSPGDFSLSVKFQKVVQHFKILRDQCGKYFLWIMKFNSINQLIEYHKNASVSRIDTIFLTEIEEKPANGQKGVSGANGNGQKVVRANFDFVAQDPEELSFKKGDLINIIEEVEKNWWKGCRPDTFEEGLIPTNYVTEVKSND